MMVDVQQLLVPTESGAGGKFVKDIAKLDIDAYIGYYKTHKAYTVPPMLLGKFINDRKTNRKLTIVDFVDSHQSEIKSRGDLLATRANNFHSKGYSNQTIKDYQALKFHKDRQPEKYDVSEEIEEFDFLKSRRTTRRDKANIEISKIAEYLNEFAEIVTLYQILVAANTSFFRSDLPLEKYVKRTFALFAKDIPDDIRQKVAKDVIEHLDASL